MKKEKEEAQRYTNIDSVIYEEKCTNRAVWSLKLTLIILNRRPKIEQKIQIYLPAYYCIICHRSITHTK